MRSLRVSKVVSVPHAIAGISSWGNAGWARRARSPTHMMSSIQPSGGHGDFLGHGVVNCAAVRNSTVQFLGMGLTCSLLCNDWCQVWSIQCFPVEVPHLQFFDCHRHFCCALSFLARLLSCPSVPRQVYWLRQCRTLSGGMQVQVQFLDKVYMPVVLQRQVYWPR